MKLVSVFVNMDRMMGRHFDRGSEEFEGGGGRIVS
jgi:hypothetical protein